MCIFSGEVESVANTSIFARMGERETPGTTGATQSLVYQMEYEAAAEVAMVLPLPVSSKSEDAVQFINLERYPQFFDDMRAGFPAPRGASREDLALSAPPTDSQLAVHEVGSYEAPFVPKVADFKRLDARFRLPEGTWEALPSYGNYGFAVFKLQSGSRQVHPMAFEFPTARPQRLFFPTVHIHDGKVHRRAEFDHALYCQLPDGLRFPRLRWDESSWPAGMFLKTRLAGKLVDPDAHCYRRKLAGMLRNEDIWV